MGSSSRVEVPPGSISKDRLPLKDMECLPRRSPTHGDIKLAPAGKSLAVDENIIKMRGLPRRRQTIMGSDTADRHARRGSLTAFTSQLLRLEAGETGETKDKYRWKGKLQAALYTRIFLSLTVVGSAVALLLAILRTMDWQKRHDFNGVCVAQWLLAAAFVSELVLHIYASGPSHCSNWAGLGDAFVIVGGGCLTACTSWGSAIFSLRIVRVGALRYGQIIKSRKKEPDQSNKNPAVQLYQLVMRTVRSSSGMFTPLEKKKLRSLLSLLAHQQIYVDATLQRGNEDYWKEYGPVERPRERPNIISGSFHDRISTTARSSTSLPPSPTQQGVLSQGMELRGGSGITLGSKMNEAVQGVLSKVDEWDFDPFELDEVTQGQPLATLAEHLFAAKYNFFSGFGFSKSHFAAYMVKVETGYGSGNDSDAINVYHNRRHATDVTQAVHYFLGTCSLGKHLEDVETVALILGALIHDFKHPGRSNTFFIKTSHTLAITYNDISILENYHLSEAFLLLRKDEFNFFRNVVSSTAQEIRSIMVSMVLATDLKVHFDVLGEFNSHLADVHEGVLAKEGRTETYVSAMKVCIKSADISHAARATELHLRWTRDVIEEFFLQGDKEKSLGLETSPLCDRHNTEIASSQKNFIGFLVKPLFKSWVSFLDCPEAEVCTASLEKNETMWVAKEKMNDNTVNFVAVSTVPTPPLTSPLKSQTRKRRRTMSIMFGGGKHTEATGKGTDGEGSRERGRKERGEGTGRGAEVTATSPSRIGSRFWDVASRELTEPGEVAMEEGTSETEPFNGKRASTEVKEVEVASTPSDGHGHEGCSVQGTGDNANGGDRVQKGEKQSRRRKLSGALPLFPRVLGRGRPTHESSTGA